MNSTNCTASKTNFYYIFKATCFDLVYRSSSGFHTMESSNAMHVGIPSYSHQ